MSGEEMAFLRLKLDQLCDGMDKVKQAQQVGSEERKKIMVALMGDEFGNEGILPRLTRYEKAHSDLKEKQEATDRKVLRWGGIVTGISFTLGLLKDSIVAAFKG